MLAALSVDRRRRMGPNSWLVFAAVVPFRGHDLGSRRLIQTQPRTTQKFSRINVLGCRGYEPHQPPQFLNAPQTMFVGHFCFCWALLRKCSVKRLRLHQSIRLDSDDAASWLAAQRLRSRLYVWPIAFSALPVPPALAAFSIAGH